MRCLITGAKGFIGRNLNEMLEAHGHEVFGIDLKDSRDVTTPGLLDDFKNIDVVFHLAAHPVAVSPNTVDAMYSVIDYVDRIGAHLIFASSAAVYQPMASVYAAQKLLCENLIRDNLESEDYTILRFFNVYGHDGHGVVDRFIRSYVRKEPIVIDGSGEQRRDFIHVSDVVSAMIVAATQDIGGTHDIGVGYPLAINDLLDYFPSAKIQYRKGNVGVLKSIARLTPNFPWHPIESDVENYINLELKNYDAT